MIVDKILGNIHDMNLSGWKVDYVVLTGEELQKTHQKLYTVGGEVIKLSLDHGQTLTCGDILKKENECITVVDLREEKVFEIRPKTNVEWAKAAFNVGNMHQKLYLYDQYLRIPYDPVLENLLELLDIEYSVKTAKLDGALANVRMGSSVHHVHHKHE